MTSEGLGEMFEGDSADMCAGKFPLVLMVGRAEGLACADLGARTPIGASRFVLLSGSLRMLAQLSLSLAQLSPSFVLDFPENVHTFSTIVRELGSQGRIFPHVWSNITSQSL